MNINLTKKLVVVHYIIVNGNFAYYNLLYFQLCIFCLKKY